MILQAEVAVSARQARASDRRGYDCSRDGRIPAAIGREVARAYGKEGLFLLLTRAGSGSNGVELPPSYLAGLAPDARPRGLGKPRDEDAEGGNQPANKSLNNRRLSLSAMNHVRYYDAAYRDQLFGPERAAFMDPAGACVKAGLPFTLHTDAPLLAAGPLISTAITRRCTIDVKKPVRAKCASPRASLRSVLWVASDLSAW